MPNMVERQISVNAPKVGKKATVTVKCFGETLQDDIDYSGSEVVKSKFMQQGVINIQGTMRNMLEKGASEEDIQRAFPADYKLGVSVVRWGGDPTEAYMSKFQAMSPEEQAAEIKRLQAQAAAKKSK